MKDLNRIFKWHMFFVPVFFSVMPVMADDLFHADPEIALRKLDSLVLNNEVFVKVKYNYISELKAKSSVGSEDEIYWKNKSIYNEYKTFDSDSALVWLDKLDILAGSLNNNDEILSNKIERSHILAATGLLVESLAEIENINSHKLPDNLRKNYYEQMSYLYSHLHQYTASQNFAQPHLGGENYYQIMQLTYVDSLKTIIRPSDSDYMWNAAWRYRSTDSLRYYRKKIEKELLGRDFSERNEALELYALSHLYAQENDRIGMINALAYSAMADIKCANREIASLQELAWHLNDHEDIDRAYSYISLCLKNAQIYKARTRAHDIARIMDLLYSRNIERNEVREAKLERSVKGLLIITGFAVIAIVVIAIQFMRLGKSNRALYRSNDLLNDNILQLTKAKNEFEHLNHRLTQLNEEMLESNMVKEEYIGYVFNICSNYLSKMVETNKLINRKLKTGQTKELLKITDSSTFINQEMKEFYQNFDAVFLHLYPDFVEEFNKLLRPEDRINLKSNELLNTELRIYALVRLGIGDSAKIAEFLHISPQTVYNNRVKVRNKAIVPKDQFANVVRRLGNINLTQS